MKNALFLIACCTFFLSCKEPREGDVIVSVDINISLRDKAGNDLLSPEYNQNYRQIKLYYIDKNGNKILYSAPSLNASNVFFVFKAEKGYRVRIFPNENKEIALPRTIIQWNDQESDEIKCQFYRTSNQLICEKVWFNDVLKYPLASTTNNGRFFELIK